FIEKTQFFVEAQTVRSDALPQRGYLTADGQFVSLLLRTNPRVQRRAKCIVHDFRPSGRWCQGCRLRNLADAAWCHALATAYGSPARRARKPAPTTGLPTDEPRSGVAKFVRIRCGCPP